MSGRNWIGVDLRVDRLNDAGPRQAVHQQTLINTALMPFEPTTCKLVLPHSSLKVNTIFEVATAAGMRTAWSDKHPACDLWVVRRLRDRAVQPRESLASVQAGAVLVGSLVIGRRWPRVAPARICHR